MPRHANISTCLLIALLLIGSGRLPTCQAAQSPARKAAVPVPKGNRILGISAHPGEDNDYGKAFSRAKAAGMQSTTLSLDWSGIETVPGEYKNAYLAIANAYYPQSHTKIDLVLRPINTNHKEVPRDLAATAFDDPVMMVRFAKMLDYVFSQIPDLELSSLAIGNEVDGYLAQDNGRWRQYQTFYNAAKAYAKSKRPGLKVGVVGTFDGLTETARAHYLSLNKSSDIIMVSYYPLNGDFTVKEPSVVGPDFDKMTRIYPRRPFVMTEAGYPSSPACNSSEEKQAAFVRNVFAAWDAHAAQINSITFSWLTDISQSAADGLQGYYGISNKAFTEFVRTLGLRTYEGSGQDKMAFKALMAEAKARGW